MHQESSLEASQILQDSHQYVLQRPKQASQDIYLNLRKVEKVVSKDFQTERKSSPFIEHTVMAVVWVSTMSTMLNSLIEAIKRTVSGRILIGELKPQ